MYIQADWLYICCDELNKRFSLQEQGLFGFLRFTPENCGLDVVTERRCQLPQVGKIISVRENVTLMAVWGCQVAFSGIP